jgi:RNA polymerase sigma-70 factor (ECF subfamily)
MERLFESAQNGDPAAFGQLLKHHEERLKRFIESRIGNHLRNRVDVDDILQETSLKAFNSLERVRWQGETALFSWLCGIALNNIYSHSRKYLKISDASPPEEVDKNASPSRQIQREERFNRLQDSLGRLSDEHQQVIRLTRIEGLPIREAAKRMNRSEKATAQLLWRATKKLKEAFGDTASLRLPADRRLDPHAENVEDDPIE